MNVLRILILVMVMPVVLTPLDPTTAHVTLDLKELDVTALVCIIIITYFVEIIFCLQHGFKVLDRDIRTDSY